MYDLTKESLIELLELTLDYILVDYSDKQDLLFSWEVREAIEKLKNLQPIAYQYPARYGSVVSHVKPKEPSPEDHNNELGDWYCNNLYKL